MQTIKLIATLAVIAAIIPYLSRWCQVPRRKRLHRRNIKKAQELKKMFRTWPLADVEARIFAYIRKIDPMVFEELILSCLQDAGARIKRNKRYTGDGGIDGVFRFNGQRWMMQAKRYSSSINPEHARDFAAICNGNPGIFVHTGRTGPKAYTLLTPNIKIISGQRLIDLILDSIAFGASNDIKARKNVANMMNISDLEGNDFYREKTNK